MSKKLYVGNLPWSVTSEELGDLFRDFGDVVSAEVVNDRETGRSRGFGFVRLEGGCDRAISELDGHEIKGRPLVVSEAREKSSRGPSRSRSYESHA